MDKPSEQGMSHDDLLTLKLLLKRFHNEPLPIPAHFEIERVLLAVEMYSGKIHQALLKKPSAGAVATRLRNIGREICEIAGDDD
jgi:late competence protein required for DNA uptake (superfamily II DNA/RNA helicase)